MTTTDVLTIKTEGRRIDPVRNQERLWLEVGTTSSNGCSVEGHRIPAAEARDLEPGEARFPWEVKRWEPVPVVIEVYADRLGAVLERTRTKAHETLYERACEQAASLTEDWIREKRKEYEARQTDEERAKFVFANCNHRPEHELVRMNYRSGLPPLVFCRVVNPSDRGQVVDAFDFAELDDAAFEKKHKARKRDFVVDAPSTPMNAAQRANEHLADVLERALSRSGGAAGAQQELPADGGKAKR